MLLYKPEKHRATGKVDSELLKTEWMGGGACGPAVPVNAHWRVVAEVSGCLIMNLPYVNQSADSLFDGGVRWTARASHRVSPYLRMMFGGKKVTQRKDGHCSARTVV